MAAVHQHTIRSLPCSERRMLPASPVRGESHGKKHGEPEIRTDDLEPGPGEDCLHHLRHVYSTFAADAAKNRNADSVPAGETDTVSFCVQKDRSCFAADLENTQTSPIGEDDGGVCVCDPSICCKKNENLEDCIGIENQNQEKTPLVCSSLLQTDANVPQKISPAANNQNPEPAVSTGGDTIKKAAPVPPGSIAAQTGRPPFAATVKRFASPGTR